MSRVYNKTIAIAALVLISIKAKAENYVANPSDEKVAAIYNEILAASKNDKNIFENVFSLTKLELEEALQVALTEDEFLTLHNLLGKLIDEGVEIQPTHPGKMVIATQEYAAGK